MQARRRLLDSLLLALCLAFQGCEEPPKTEVPEDNPSMHLITFTDGTESPTELKIGDLLRWHDPDENEEVMCFKLDPTGRWNYGEFIVTRSPFEWDDLDSIPTIELTENELAQSDMRLGDDFTFSSARITIESFSDREDIVQATIVGTAVDKNQKSHDFQLSSQFHVVRPEKHANYWRQRLEASMADHFPSHSTVRHFTEPSDYGLRYGDVYFSEFKTADGDRILIQRVFDSADACELYVAEPDDPLIDSEERTFAFTESGLERLAAYINHENTKR